MNADGQMNEQCYMDLYRFIQNFQSKIWISTKNSIMNNIPTEQHYSGAKVYNSKYSHGPTPLKEILSIMFAINTKWS